MWLHWTPAQWRGAFPFEIGLFFFLTLTGFLITRILLRERITGEETSKPWRVKAYLAFQKRRMLRILLPCYAAMIFALLVGAKDILHHPWFYFSHLSNFHMATMERWPSGTAHYWTLAIQVQFYLLWPLVVFAVPKRAMIYTFLAFTALAPISRMILAIHFPQIHHSQAITAASFDYFAVGAWLALALQRGMIAGDTRLKWASWLAFAGYGFLYVCDQCSAQIPGFCYLQQTLISIVFAGLISTTLRGFSGPLGSLLDHPLVQNIGRLSFGLYLFHTPVPLFLGWVLPGLWHPFFDGPWLLVRLLGFALTSWALAFLCWKYLESKPALARQPEL